MIPADELFGAEEEITLLAPWRIVDIAGTADRLVLLIEDPEGTRRLLLVDAESLDGPLDPDTAGAD